jgi:hypothetical protein
MRAPQGIGGTNYQRTYGVTDMLALIPVLLSNWKMIFYGGVIAAVIGFGLYEYHHIYAAGEAAALEQVNKSNEQSEKNAEQGSSAVDACYAGGGTWDRVNGVCVRPAGQ